jgi:mono/diheme cytochrome c family protein
MACKLLAIEAMLLSLCILAVSSRAAALQSMPLHPLRLQSVRQLATDLELTGLLPGLRDGAAAYVARAELLALPQVSAELIRDENFPGVSEVRITGVRLQTLSLALHDLPQSDLIDLRCSDGYRAQLTRPFIAEHQPILALTIDGIRPEQWAGRTHRDNPGPYFIAYANFHPAFRVLSHLDYAQVPANIVRLNFTTTAATFGPITPPHTSLAIEQGFTIAQQNCLRCHSKGAVGGTKSRYSWDDLSQVARDAPRIFTGYVRNPKSLGTDTQMPANPNYDNTTLAALRAYFASLPTTVPRSRP